MDDAETLDWNGTTFRAILTRAASGGGMTILDVVSPRDSGPPRHIHDAEDETFVILSGECQFWVAGETVTRGPGETVFVPRGVEHAFKVISDHPCRHLVILTPGGFEDFFAEMAAAGCRIPEDMAALTAAASRHNMRFTGPPL